MTQEIARSAPRVVIVGAGFGGLSAAKTLGSTGLNVTLIDKQNHHLFQPLLYQVATASLSPADIAAPIRSVLRDQKNVRVLLDCLQGIDPETRTLTLCDSEPMTYDWLILATGARHSYFGNDQWAHWAPGLKTIDDATEVRRNVLLSLERAEIELDKARRDSLLTFVIIGGGPTGVEMAGAIAELARKSVSMDFRTITPHCSRVILVDSGDRLLKSFPENLSAKAQKALESLGVEVRLGIRITEVHDHGVMIGNELVGAYTIIWAAGVMASPAATWLGCDGDRTGRVKVGPDLRVIGKERIFAIGDTAHCAAADGTALPGVAPVAKQQGVYAALSIIAAEAGKTLKPFRYRDYGNLATIGRKRAVADFGRFRVSGFVAWILWCVAHIWFLIGFRSRITVSLNWLWNYITFEKSARLITGLVDGRPATIVPRDL
jgi:NADH:ubiquinone reductase (H+-translocating)